MTHTPSSLAPGPTGGRKRKCHTRDRTARTSEVVASPGSYSCVKSVRSRTSRASGTASRSASPPPAGSPWTRGRRLPCRARRGARAPEREQPSALRGTSTCGLVPKNSATRTLPRRLVFWQPPGTRPHPGGPQTPRVSHPPFSRSGQSSGPLGVRAAPGPTQD